MSFEEFSHLSGTWGLVALVIMFIGAVTYAFWPGNKDKFKNAAQLPLDEVPSDKKETHS